MTSRQKAIKERIFNFFRETQSELKRTNWPTKEETIRYTWVVLGLSIFLIIVLGSLDYLFTYIVTKYLL